MLDTGTEDLLASVLADVEVATDVGCVVLIGAAQTRELHLLSDRIDAAEAKRLGLINRVVPDDTLEKETLALAQRLAHGPSVAYR